MIKALGLVSVLCFEQWLVVSLLILFWGSQGSFESGQAM